MSKTKNILNNQTQSQRGAMMVELLLMISLVAVMMPFLLSFHRDRIERAHSIAVAQEMQSVQTALERYIDFHKKELLTPVGRNITRVKITDLESYGAPSATIEKYGDKFQLRVLKSSDRNGRATLQGVVVLNDNEITPLRTREIINLGGDRFGFVEQGQAFGAFGTWHASASDLGIGATGGIVETTKATLDQEEYLWRLPSENASDATMRSALNMAGHNILNTKFLDTRSMRFEEIISSVKMVANQMIFQSRTTIDRNFETADATVSGTLSGDARSMNITGTLTLADSARLSSFTADDFWVNNLNLSGISISTNSVSNVATMKVSQTVDMVAGHISAMYATVGFTGSITPKLTVRYLIEDSTNPDYFWDASSATARLQDVSFAELNRMATIISSREGDLTTASGQLFRTVATNKNATASDFMNAIREMQNRVRGKYRQLNLE